MEDTREFKQAYSQNLANGSFLSREKFIFNFEKITRLLFEQTDLQERANFYTNVMNNARAVNCADMAEKTLQEKAVELGEPELWELPESFDRPKALEPFPMQSLPPLLRDYLKAVADYVQVTPEMAVLPLLSVLSLCVQGKAVIKHTGNSHTEPLNLYTITVASPGERKSGSLKEFMRPVEEFQDCYNKIHASEIEEYKTEHTFLENQKNAALKGRNADLHRAKRLQRKFPSLKENTSLYLTSAMQHLRRWQWRYTDRAVKSELLTMRAVFLTFLAAYIPTDRQILISS